jgi:hypothetical protein
MGRSTAISRFLSLFRTGSAAAAGLATILSCSDNSTAPSASNRNPAVAGIEIVVFHVPDSLKRVGPHASSTQMLGAPHISRDVTVPDVLAPSTYTISTVEFKPEPSPINSLMPDPSSPEPNCDDCVAYHVPIGFDFTFYGNSYSQIQISSNGLLRLGSDKSLMDGCCWGGEIPVDDMYNNIIAVAWTDLVPSAPGDISFETQGTAPNRKFVVQWNNVPEQRDPFPMVPGHVTAQLVLAEGSNDITMYTTKMDFTGEFHFVTQGIENADGSEAAFLPERMQARFPLSNDAIRFSIRPVGKPITLVASANIEVGTDARACFATVALAQPTVSGGGDGLTVAGHRNDGLALDASYPKGVTTITWAATDASGTTELATQSVTVADRESPQITLPANVVVGNDPGLASAFVNVGDAYVEDNCPNYSINQPANGVYPVGTTEVVWTAIDESGNTSSATQLVTVKDVEAPTIDLPSSGLTVNATSPAGAVVSFASFGHDNVGVTSFSCTRISGTRFPIGRTSVSCSAVDAAGNMSAPALFSVTVLGAAQQLVNLMESINGLLPIGAGESDDHQGNDGHGNNDDHRSYQHAGPHGDQIYSALSSGLGNSRSTRGACPALNVIAALVRAKTPAVIPAAKSAQILADVARIKNVIPCR